MNRFRNFAFILILCAFPSLFSNVKWEGVKNVTIAQMEDIPGWCSSEKAKLMMDVIRENKCQYCVEVGVLAGRSLFPIANALQFNGKGEVFAIDAWDAGEAVKGFELSDPNYKWWKQQDYESLYKRTLSLIDENDLREFCSVIRSPSQDAVHQFSDGSIDFLHLDGNHNEVFAFRDLKKYFPKVKDGGFILLNDSNWFGMRRSLVFLLEKTELLSPFSPLSTYLLFRKSNQRERNASSLFLN